jgi:RNA polymerase primary sigma factor
VMRSSFQSGSVALARLCQADVLSIEDERQLFRHLKQARERAAQSPHTHRGQIPTGTTQKSAARVISLRNQIAVANLRLVVSLAKRFARPQQSLEDLLSEASVLLLRCVERFDAERGTRFSTYATCALTHHFVRLRRRERHRSLRAISLAGRHGISSDSGRCDALDRLIDLEDLQRLKERLVDLPVRERVFLEGRFGLNQDAPPQTFQELAVSHGLSKEWARVVTASALDRLRESLADMCCL